MPPLNVGDLVAAAGGTLLRGDPETRVESFSIDTRTLRRGAVFFALRGSRGDGHDFLPAAALAGAAAAVISREPANGMSAPPALIRVEDPVAAVARCGTTVRKRLGLKVVAVTGSTGKTTTKELIAAGLAARRRVHRSAGNLNNHLGVPLSLLECPEKTEVAVIEMGMSAPGEIAALMRIADPDIGLVTNIRPVHLEFFDSVDGIAAAKGEMYALLREDATAVVNFDDERCRVQAARHAGRRVSFGREPSADLALESIDDRFAPGASLSFRHAGRTRALSLKLGGSRAALNALAALAAVAAAGEDIEAAAAAMAEVRALDGRGRVHRLSGDRLLVDESYNSNPEAVASVIETLRASSPQGRKILVLGDMLELGPDEIPFHREAGERAAAAGVDVLFGVGARSRAAVEAARKARLPETYHEPDADSAARAVVGHARPGDLVVVKGSRGVHLEKVVEALLAAFPEEC